MAPSPLLLFQKGAKAISLLFLLRSLLKGKLAWAPTLKTALKKTKEEQFPFKQG